MAPLHASECAAAAMYGLRASCSKSAKPIDSSLSGQCCWLASFLLFSAYRRPQSAADASKQRTRALQISVTETALMFQLNSQTI
jgi:hypothetical protein